MKDDYGRCRILDASGTVRVLVSAQRSTILAPWAERAGAQQPTPPMPASSKMDLCGGCARRNKCTRIMTIRQHITQLRAAAKQTLLYDWLLTRRRLASYEEW